MISVYFRLLTIWVGLQVVLCAADMKPVPLGKASYADRPPANHKEVRQLFAREGRIEKKLVGKPLPTNDWWTGLLVNRFPQRLYALPAIVGTHSGGLRIWFPTRWNDGGTEMVQESPLSVDFRDNSPTGPQADRVVFNFDFERWPAGWKVTGDAFGIGPMGKGARAAASNFVGSRYIQGFSSRGDAGLGTLTTPAFRVDRDYLHLLVGGGSDGKARVEVLVEGKVVSRVIGKNANDLSPRSIDLRAYRGKKARLRLVDETRGGWGWIACDHVLLSQAREPKGAGPVTGCRLAAFGDWALRMRMHGHSRASADVTFGRGLPYVWIESNGLSLSVPAKLEEVTGIDGKVRGKVSAVRINRKGARYALFGPKSCRMRWKDGKVKIDFRNGKRFLAVALVDSWDRLAVFQRHAFAIPRDTRFEFRYAPKEGLVYTDWRIEAEALEGEEKEVLQGWLPHHWRTTKHSLRFTSVVYATRRGQMKCSAGNRARISWRFPGMLPSLPLPKGAVGLRTWLAEQIDREIKAETGKRKPYGDDTYWGAKYHSKLAQKLMIAKQLGEPRRTRALQGLLTDCLHDWLSYVPGEKSRYFAMYPAPWRGMVGFKTSYGSGGFTDNHFHYGYLTLSAALAGIHDPAWLRDHGEMLKLVAKQYANWDRNDLRFPYLRTFDPWAGHSYAGGVSIGYDGNNQESSSEAMQSWAGVFLLGVLLGDENMQACGAMGYAIEGEAIDEYWNDWYGKLVDRKRGNHPPQYKNTIVSVMRDRDLGYFTWFSGAPIHIYGIQWLPGWSTMHYWGRRPELVKLQVDAMQRRSTKGAGPKPLINYDPDWGNTVLGYLLWGDPGRVCAELRNARVKGRKIGGGGHAVSTTFLAESMRHLGRVDWASHSDLPTSLIFVDQAGRRTLVAYNQGAAARTVEVFVNGKVIAQKRVLPGGPHRLRLP